MKSMTKMVVGRKKSRTKNKRDVMMSLFECTHVITSTARDLKQYGESLTADWSRRRLVEMPRDVQGNDEGV